MYSIVALNISCEYICCSCALISGLDICKHTIDFVGTSNCRINLFFKTMHTFLVLLKPHSNSANNICLHKLAPVLLLREPLAELYISLWLLSPFQLYSNNLVICCSFVLNLLCFLPLVLTLINPAKWASSLVSHWFEEREKNSCAGSPSCLLLERMSIP